jgi:rhodanese-related sulfurtransferase
LENDDRNNSLKAMSQPDPPFSEADQQTPLTPEELDERIFHLKTLYEASCEIPGLVRPKKIMEAFLLTSMGVAGATRGLVVFFNAQTGQGDLVHRGLDTKDAKVWQEQIVRIGQYHFPPDYLLSAAAQARSIQIVKERHPESLPPDMELMLKGMVNETYGVFVGLEDSLKEKPFAQADVSVILHLAGTLVKSLAQTLCTQRIHQLNADLVRQSTSLQEALGRADKAHQELDRKVFHLKTLYELTAELSPINQSEKLLETFLLMAMGAVGCGQGILLILDRGGRTVHTAARGTDLDREWSVEAVEKLLYRGFHLAENRRLEPMSATFINDPQQVLDEPETGLVVHTAFLFTVDDSLLGLVGLGVPLNKTVLGPEQRDLLRGLTKSFMIFLKNVRSYELVQALNTDLHRTNEQLRRTISDLTEARDQIRILEIAKTRLKQLVAHEVDRLGRFRPVDVVLILAVACFLAFFFNLSNPNGIPLFPERFSEAADLKADPEFARHLVTQEDAVLVDARPQELFKRKHIPEAINVPAPLFDIIYPMKIASRLMPNQTVVVYGRTISKHYDDEVAYRILQRHEQVRVLAGGITAWEKHGYPVAP